MGEGHKVQVILYTTFLVWHLPLKPAWHEWQSRFPAGQDGGSKADLVRQSDSVLPPFHGTRKGSLDAFTAEFICLVSLSSTKGRVIYVSWVRVVCFGGFLVARESVLVCLMSFDTTRRLVCAIIFSGYPFAEKSFSIREMPRCSAALSEARRLALRHCA